MLNAFVFNICTFLTVTCVAGRIVCAAAKLINFGVRKVIWNVSIT